MDVLKELEGIIGRTYSLSLDELRWLVQIDEERNETTECHNCADRDDDCESCIAAHDLSKKLADALSLAEAGCQISFFVDIPGVTGKNLTGDMAGDWPMTRLPNESLIDFVFRFFNRENVTHKSGSEIKHAAESTSEGRLVSVQAPAGVGEPQPVCRVLDESEDIAAEYSKPWVFEPLRDGHGNTFQVSGREIHRQGDVIPDRKSPPSPAPKNHARKSSVLSMLVDTECETVIDSNRYGDLVCSAEAIGVCKHCLQLVCRECVRYGSCLIAVNCRHEVVEQ